MTDNWNDWSTNPPPTGVLLQVQRETAGMPEQPWTTKREDIPRGTITHMLKWRLTDIAKQEQEPSFDDLLTEWDKEFLRKAWITVTEEA